MPKTRQPRPASLPRVEPSALLDRAAAAPDFAARLERLAGAGPGRPVVFDHVAAAGQPFYAALAARRWLEDHPPAAGRAPVVWIACPHVKAQEILHAELNAWGMAAECLPEHEWVAFEDVIPDPQSAAERLATLQRLWDRRTSGQPQVVVLSQGSLSEAATAPGSGADGAVGRRDRVAPGVRRGRADLDPEGGAAR